MEEMATEGSNLLQLNDPMWSTENKSFLLKNSPYKNSKLLASFFIVRFIAFCQVQSGGYSVRGEWSVVPQVCCSSGVCRLSHGILLLCLQQVPLSEEL